MISREKSTDCDEFAYIGFLFWLFSCGIGSIYHVVGVGVCLNDKDLESILCSPCCFGSFVVADKRILQTDLKNWSDE